MAYINVDEVYVLDNTGLQVDQVVDLPYRAAGLTDAQKAQARANIGAGGSNRNLLDNWYFVGGGTSGAFPINQRGASSYTGIVYGIDRWKTTNNNSSIAINSDYITVTAASGGNAFFVQFTELQYEGTYTFSAYIKGSGIGYFGIANADRSVLLSSKTFSNVGNDWTLLTGTFTTSGTKIGCFTFRINAGSSIDIKCVKLEVGTVSTLLNDAPPDYGTELAKCQRYFLRLTGSSWQIFGSGWNSSTTIADILIPTPVTMRANPTLSYTGTFSVRTNGADKAISAASSFAVQQNGVYAVFTSSGLTANQMACVVSVGGTIDLSADL